MLSRWRVVFQCVSRYFSFEPFEFAIAHRQGVWFNECLSWHICIIVSNESVCLCMCLCMSVCDVGRCSCGSDWRQHACMWLLLTSCQSRWTEFSLPSSQPQLIRCSEFVCVCVCVFEFWGVSCVSVCVSQSSSIMHGVTFQCEGKQGCRCCDPVNFICMLYVCLYFLLNENTTVSRDSAGEQSATCKRISSSTCALA